MKRTLLVLSLIAALPLVAAPVPAKKEKGGEVPFSTEALQRAPPIATGAIRRFLINPHGEVDGFLLADGTLVKFPPHMAGELTAAAKIGDTVSVRGFRELRTSVKARIVTNEASKEQVVERRRPRGVAKMPKHLRFATLSRITAAGQVERTIHGKKGEIKAVLLDDGTVVRFPKHAAEQFTDLLQPGRTLAAEGLGTENQYGRGLEATALGASPDALTSIYGR